MTEIGATLREARMRAGIDIAEVEARTKIRSKYLRALENEEWSLLPGTTFVKSFLRTYAEALGLDAKLLVEEYKFRHEPYETAAGIAGIGSGGEGSGWSGGHGGRGGGGAFGHQRPIWLPLLALLALVAIALIVVYRTSKSEMTPDPPARATGPPATTTTQKTATRSAAERKRISLRISVPTGATTVYACVQDARGRSVVNGKLLRGGSHTKTLKSSRFKIALSSPASSGRPRVTVGGKRQRLHADDKGVIAYELTRGHERILRPGHRPSCSR